MDNVTAHDYVFERLGEAQLPLLQALFQLSFGVSPTLDELSSKYETSSLGAGVVGIIAFSSSGESAAYYGVFPAKVRIGEDIFLVAQSGDTMTAPAHRGKGLFVDTAQKVYEIAGNEGIRFVFGFPNANSFPGFKSKLGWTFFGNMYNFRIPCFGLPGAALSKKFRFLRKGMDRIQHRKLSKISIPATAEVIASFSPPKTNLILRDLAYFEYKLKRSAYLIRWKGFKLVVKIDGELVLGDVAAFDAAQFPKFLASIKGLARHLFCHKVLITVSTNHWLFPLLQAHNIQAEISLPIGFVALDAAEYPFETISFSRFDYDTF